MRCYASIRGWKRGAMPGRLWRQCYASDRYPDGSDQTELRKELRHFSRRQFLDDGSCARPRTWHPTGPIGRIDRGRYGVDGPLGAEPCRRLNPALRVYGRRRRALSLAPPRLQFSDPLGTDIKTDHRTAGARERPAMGNSTQSKPMTAIFRSCDINNSVPRCYGCH